MNREVINELKKYTSEKKNTERIEISVLQLNRVIKALEQEPNEEDIHREREQAYMQGYEDACKKYRKEPKTGHWIDHRYYMECSICEFPWKYSENMAEQFKYCPNCGAKMESEG